MKIFSFVTFIQSFNQIFFLIAVDDLLDQWGRAKQTYTDQLRAGRPQVNPQYQQLRCLDEFVSPIVINPIDAFNTIEYLEEALKQAIQRQLYLFDQHVMQWTNRRIAEIGLRITIQVIFQRRREIGLMTERLATAQGTIVDLDQEVAMARRMVYELFEARQRAEMINAHNQQATFDAINLMIQNLQAFMRNLI